MHVAAIVGLLVILLTATLRPVNVGAVALVGAFAIGTFVAGESITTVYSGSQPISSSCSSESPICSASRL